MLSSAICCGDQKAPWWMGEHTEALSDVWSSRKMHCSPGTPPRRGRPSTSSWKGALLRAGACADPIGSLFAKVQPPAADRWAVLGRIAVQGMVSFQAFIEIFKLVGNQTPNKAAYRVGKRLRAHDMKPSMAPLAVLMSGLVKSLD